MDRRLIRLPLLAMMLAACTRPPDPAQIPGGRETEPHPPVPAVRIATTPYLETWVTRRLIAFRSEFGTPDFRLETMHAGPARDAVEREELVLVIAALPPPEGWFVTPLGQEGIAVVVHPDNPVRSFRLETLRNLFSGRVFSWATLNGPARLVQPVVPLAGDDLRAHFTDVVLGGEEPAATALLAPSPAAARAFLEGDQAAIGLLPFAELTPEVRAARVEGVLPSETALREGRYPLVIEVLALAPEEPEGSVRAFLAWIQRGRAAPES